MNASTANFTCNLRGADVPTTVKLTFSAPFLPPTMDAAAPAAAPAQNAADAPQIHLQPITLRKSPRGYVIASLPVSAINMGNKTIYVNYSSTMKTVEPATGGEFSPTTGKFGVPGNNKAYKVYTLRFAIQGKSEAQIRKQLKVTISNPTGGAVITVPTATVSS